MRGDFMWCVRRGVLTSSYFDEFYQHFKTQTCHIKIINTKNHQFLLKLQISHSCET